MLALILRSIDGQPDVPGPIAAHITRKLAESNHIPTSAVAAPLSVTQVDRVTVLE